MKSKSELNLSGIWDEKERDWQRQSYLSDSSHDPEWVIDHPLLAWIKCVSLSQCDDKFLMKIDTQQKYKDIINAGCDKAPQRDLCAVMSL